MSHERPAGLRPSDLALFLLASGEVTPRKRARDQQADIAGLALKSRVLDLIVAHDPEPEELELCLARIVEEIGPPTGPTRGICTTVRDEWEMAAAADVHATGKYTSTSSARWMQNGHSTARTTRTSR